MAKWKVAVVGCGSFANGQYFPNISKTADAECVAAVDIVPERAKAAAEKFGIPNWYSSVEELIEKCDFDIAIDAASIPAHYDINMAVLRSGHHLISQKPAALTVDLMTEEIETAKANNVKFVCVPIHVMTPDQMMAMEIIEKGIIGRVLSVKCVSAHGGPEYFQGRKNDPSWFYGADAGAMFDMGVHALHKVTGIMGPAKRLGCMAATGMRERICRSGAFDGVKIKTDYLPDTYYIALDFGGDRVGLVDTGFHERASKCPPLEIYGENGVISFYDHGGKWPVPDVYTDLPEYGPRGWKKADEFVEDKRPEFFTQCCPLADMVNALENDCEPMLTPEHARHVIEIMSRMHEAYEGGIFIDLKTTF